MAGRGERKLLGWRGREGNLGSVCVFSLEFSFSLIEEW